MPQRKQEILIEFVQQGAYIKVSAVDAQSGLEVSVVGDAKQPQKALENAAIKKLHYVRNKRRQQREQQMKSKNTYGLKGRSHSGWDL